MSPDGESMDEPTWSGTRSYLSSCWFLFVYKVISHCSYVLAADSPSTPAYKSATLSGLEGRNLADSGVVTSLLPCEVAPVRSEDVSTSDFPNSQVSHSKNLESLPMSYHFP